MLCRFLKSISAVLAACIIIGSMPAQKVYAEPSDNNMPDFSFIGSASGFTKQQCIELAQMAYDGLAAHSEEIIFRLEGVEMTLHPNMEAVAGIFREVAQDFEVGIMTNATSILCEGNSDNAGNSFVRIVPTYVVDDAQYDSAYQTVMTLFDDIAAKVNADWSGYEKALFLHDYLAQQYDYDHTLLKHTAYEMLTTGDAVCDGYSSLYSMLLNRLGIHTQRVVSKELNHSWNVVELDGDLYHVDVTFDDSYHYGHPGLVMHEYFLKTTDEMRASRHNADDFRYLFGRYLGSEIASEPTTGFWDGTDCAVSPISINGDPSYVMWAVVKEEDGKEVSIGLWDQNSSRGEPRKYASLFSRSSIWNVPGTNMYYPGSYSGAFSSDNVLFFTTSDEILALYNGKVISLYKLTDEQKQTGRIYGLREKDGDLYYYVSRAPASDEEHGNEWAKSEEYVLLGYTLDRWVDKIKSEAGESAVSLMINGEEVLFQGDMTYHVFSVDQKPGRDGFLLRGVYYDTGCTDGMKVGHALIIRDRTFYTDWYRCGIAGARASIEDSITLSMYMAFDDALMENEDNYFTVTTPGNENEPQIIYFSDVAPNKDDAIDGYHFADVTVPAKDMEQTVSVEAFVGGQSCGVQTYCVNDFLKDITESADSRFDAFRGLARAALTYGACANAFFDQDESGLTDEMRDTLAQADIEPPAGADFGASVDVDNIDGVIYTGSSIILESKTVLRHRFGILQGKDIADYKVTIDGDEVTPTFSESVTSNGAIYDVYDVDITGIAANELMLRRRVELSDGTNTDVIDVGVCGFAYQSAVAGINGGNYVDLMRSLILYAKEAGQFA